MIDGHVLIYLLSVGAAGPLLLWLLGRYMDRVEEQRLERLKRMERFTAIETETTGKRPNGRRKVDSRESLISKFSIIRRLLLVILGLVWIILLAFPFLGSIPKTLVSVLVGGSAVIVGIAARPFVENMISGIVISFSKQLRTGDTVLVDEQYGTVEDILLTHTIIKLWDWRRYIIPNSRMLTKEIQNFTIYDRHIWEHVSFWISYDADLEQVEDIAKEGMRNSEYFAGFEEPRFWTMDLEKEGIHCWIAGWTVSPSDAWMLKVEVRSHLVKEFKKAGIQSHFYNHQWKDSAPPDEENYT